MPSSHATLQTEPYAVAVDSDTQGMRPSNILFALLASIFAVFSHWGFWDIGVYALGWNTSVSYLCVLTLLLHDKSFIKFRENWAWLVPIAFMALSFGLYENPWLKAINMMALPMSIGVFLSYAHTIEKHQQWWSSHFLIRLGFFALRVLPQWPQASKHLRSVALSQVDGPSISIAKRIARSIAVLIPLMFVILALLSSADQQFDQLLERALQFIGDMLKVSIFAKLLFIILLWVTVVAALNVFRKPFIYEGPVAYRAVDNVTAAIVLFAILVVYIAFLTLQIEYLLVDQLPIEFGDTERIVKSGFWQLFFLSIINLGLFYWAYRNTAVWLQWLLSLYLLASVLILLSAAWRMVLYVYYYGLSYEKFFASYTTFYALGLFVFLGFCLLAKKPQDLVKGVVFSVLWMFSLATISPIEKLIFSSNMALSKQADSRIDLYHLSYLSADVLSDAAIAFEQRRFKANSQWAAWLHSTKRVDCQRAWYSTNLSLELNCASVDEHTLPVSNWYPDQTIEMENSETPSLRKYKRYRSSRER